MSGRGYVGDWLFFCFCETVAYPNLAFPRDKKPLLAQCGYSRPTKPSAPGRTMVDPLQSLPRAPPFIKKATPAHNRSEPKGQRFGVRRPAFQRRRDKIGNFNCG